MKVRLKAQMAGADGVYAPGTVRDLDEAQAQQLIDGGYAEAIEPEPAPVVEAAALTEDTERAVLDQRPARRGARRGARPLAVVPPAQESEPAAAEPPAEPPAPGDDPAPGEERRDVDEGWGAPAPGE